MKRERLMWGFILFAVLGAFFSVYQFYFKEKLAAYAKDAIAKKNAEDSYKQLRQSFEGTDPKGVIDMWSNVVQPWKDAVLDRGKYFNDGGWSEHTRPGDDVPILRFWYDEQLQKELGKLYTEAQVVPGLQQFPQYEELIKELKVATLAEFQNRDVTASDVNKELSKLAFGMNVCRMLFKAKASVINQVWLWPGRELKEQEGLVRFWTLGLDIGMDMKALVRFIEDNLRTAPRYFNIEGIKIQYPYVGYNVEPVLRVQMLLTTATFVEAKAGTVEGAAGPAGTPNNVVANFALKGGEAKVVEEPTGLAAAWKWFKRTVLVMN